MKNMIKSRGYDFEIRNKEKKIEFCAYKLIIINTFQENRIFGYV